MSLYNPKLSPVTVTPRPSGHRRGHRATQEVTLESVIAPSDYNYGASYTLVTTLAELVTALGSSTPTIIVMQNGTYGAHTTYLNFNAKHKLYAQTLLGAELQSGLAIGTSGADATAGNATVQGIKFNVTSTTPTLNSAVIETWGAQDGRADAIRIYDCEFIGGGASPPWNIPYGVHAKTHRGGRFQRLVFRKFTDEGLRVWSNSPGAGSYYTYGDALAMRADTVTDIYSEDIYRTATHTGTAESGLTIGSPVTNGVRRIKSRRVGWMGLATLKHCWDTTFSHLDLDPSGIPNAAHFGAQVGVYLEHRTINCTFEHFNIAGVEAGFNGEWVASDPDGKGGPRDCTIRDGTITNNAAFARGEGIYLDEGCVNTKVHRVRFFNQDTACISAYLNIDQPLSNYVDNDYSGRNAGAVKVSNVHISASTPWPELLP